jgi:hypothetical protein
MSASIDRARRSVRLRSREQKASIALGVIVATQALWLFVALRGGWYTEADLPNLAAANGRKLDLGYLTESIGGHLGIPGRATYWILNRVAPLNWELTVALRAALQAIATILLYRLIVLLVGSRSWLILVVACYAFNPLLLPGLAWLSSGIGLAASQLFVLISLVCHVQYTRSKRVWYAVAVGSSLMLAIFFADQAILTVLIYPILSFGFLYTGPPSVRLRSALARWPGWLAVAAAPTAFVALYLRGDYNRGSATFGLSPAWEVARSEWLDVLGPALVGGPWRWAANPVAYVSYARPPAVAVLVGQLAILVVLVIGWRRTGPRVLAATSLPVISGIGGVLLVGRGRYDVLGTFITPILRYSFQVAVPLAVGITLCFALTPELQAAKAAVRVRTEDTEYSLPAYLSVLAAVLVLAASFVSGAAFVRRFWDNPAKHYIDNLIVGARAAGPEVNIYDSAINGDVIPYIEPNHYVSDVLRLAGVQARYDDPSSEPVVAAPDGRLVAARFVPAADARGPAKPGCGTYIGGRGSWLIAFSSTMSTKDWYLRLELYQPRPNRFSVEIIDRDGAILAPARGATVAVSRKLEAVNLRLPISSPTALVIRTDDPATTLCLVHTYVGVPLPRVAK